MESMESRVREFISTNFPVDAGEELATHQNLLDAGVVDSIGVLTIVTWIEETFEVTVDDEDVLPENLGSIAGIVAYVERKQREAGH
ncbi:acyl carrier protein [Pseudoxanthomonas japonensis]|uniref:acyl carrier protein n=1 Tax=Bacteria TaxID=2 RepID=UPI0007836C68|nr:MULTISPECIES: acyl carrier protein [Pseudoxanthomonas]MBA3930892.1 acyl carrier protein [Xanthomonas sp.]MBL8257094.1 acyl carrier protein [Pseudoxanthomonas mexicana]MDR7067467.1 acyl carrier protein [Pseudoxanthomonas japonensis]